MKKVILREEAREGLYRGVQLLTDVVQTTLGPRGSNVVFDASYGLAYPIVTKDGVTVARNVDSDDLLESMGIRLIRHASQLTNKEVGDGTTTSTVLTNEIVKLGSQVKSINNSKFINGMTRAQELVETFIDEHTVDINDDFDKASQVAYISANSDKVIGGLVAEAYQQVGQFGSISVQPSKTGENYVEFQKGLEFNSGAAAIQFLELDKPFTVIKDANILVTNFEIKDIREFANNEAEFSKLLFVERKPVVLICSDVTVEVLGQLIFQTQQAGAKLYVIKAPSFGASRDSFLMDIAVLTGGKFLDSSLGDTIIGAQAKDYGKSKSVSLSMDKTIIHGGEGNEEQVTERVNYLTSLLDEKDLSDDMRESVKERLSKINGGVAEIYIDAVSDVQYEETSFRVRDAISATGASLRGGVVAGGGVTLYKASSEVQKIIDTLYVSGSDEHTGATTLLKALRKPFEVILSNADMDAQEMGEKVLKAFKKGEEHVGVDVLDETVCDLVEKGIIDPALVTKSAVRNAVRMGGTLLTTSSAIVTHSQEK